MRIAIKKWGNSAGMIIPAQVLEQLHLQVGQELFAEIRGDELILKSGKRKYTLAELIAECDPEASPASDMAIWQGSDQKGNEVW
ncbi:AbrB/MazE/SpoVT family DNA-binding domain-containing protein [Sodalis ligni]|uniref:AbrB/MazE/SpoVT family DNA-binding domain-containing protein n=1 Tax=Sodalis ligni TaxID=2697027 RepID=UPI00193ECDA3|nr:AbrB/MazE/SpoVT family DNA-binding domain-containing protein [Sodalis ligni]QWA09372.1 AbrB/MazE/SpoVT family DNA-binding domain-containing protein [Sodalis ligni]